MPFYVALPHSTIDWTIDDGRDDPDRGALGGRGAEDARAGSPTARVVTVEIAAPGSPAGNPAFDVTPARLVTGFITERGVAPASAEGLASLYPEKCLRNRTSRFRNTFEFYARALPPLAAQPEDKRVRVA